MFSLDFFDISLLLAVNSFFLLIASEMLSPNLKKVNILINKKKLQRASIFVSLLFLFTFAMRIVVPFLTS
jgi:hypothetical protein